MIFFKLKRHFCLCLSGSDHLAPSAMFSCHFLPFFCFSSVVFYFVCMRERSDGWIYRATFCSSILSAISDLCLKLLCTNNKPVYSANWYLAFWRPVIYPLKHLCVVLLLFFFFLFNGILCFISNCKCCFGSVSLSWSVCSLKRKDLFSRHWSSFCFCFLMHFLFLLLLFFKQRESGSIGFRLGCLQKKKTKTRMKESRRIIVFFSALQSFYPLLILCRIKVHFILGKQIMGKVQQE